MNIKKKRPTLVTFIICSFSYAINRFCWKYAASNSYDAYAQQRNNSFFFYPYVQVLYSRIAVVLWKSSKGLEKQIAMRYGPSHTNSSANYCNYVMQRGKSKYDSRSCGGTSTGREVSHNTRLILSYANSIESRVHSTVRRYKWMHNHVDHTQSCPAGHMDSSMFLHSYLHRYSSSTKKKFLIGESISMVLTSVKSKHIVNTDTANSV